jgi:hypothetical protein
MEKNKKLADNNAYILLQLTLDDFDPDSDSLFRYVCVAGVLC